MRWRPNEAVIVDKIKAHLLPKVHVILIEDTESNKLRTECRITDEDLKNIGVAGTNCIQGVLYALNEDPVIRYYDPNGTGESPSARLAKFVLDEIKIIKSRDSTFPSPTPYDIHGPATVLILDRTVDLLSPLIHSLGFQVLLYDCLGASNLQRSMNYYNQQAQIREEEQISYLINSLHAIQEDLTDRKLRDILQFEHAFTTGDLLDRRKALEKLKELFAADDSLETKGLEEPTEPICGSFAEGEGEGLGILEGFKR
ncbi:vacuolar sorting protein VPS33/slp1 [Phlyctochytrium bullatum]|nr:vacuolar sorting protein VPS33/slp1 [Phlyctochytrium bullatum]